MKKLDLSSYASDGIRILSGRDRGEFVRKEFRLGELDVGPPDEIVFVLPATAIRHVNSSFFLGLIGESVQKLGRDAFLKRYKVESVPTVEERFRQAIDRVLLQTEPLP